MLKKTIRLILINIAVFSTILVLSEFLGQLGFYAVKGYWISEGNPQLGKVLEAHPYLVGRLRKAIQVEVEGTTISTTDLHTRWTGAPVEDQSRIRIAILGGSTAFGTGVSDKDSWPALLQEFLGENYSIYNFGVPGYSTSEAIIQTALIIPKIKPHIIIQYHGWNDIHHYHFKNLGQDYIKHGRIQQQSLGFSNFGSNFSFIKKAGEVSALFYFSHSITKIFDKESKIENCTPSEKPDHFVDEIYQRNLNSLKALGKNMNSKTIFIPQVLNFYSYKNKSEPYAWTPCIKNDAMPNLLKRFNYLINNVCYPENENCYILSEINEINWENQDFIDEGHFSSKGGAKFSKKVAVYINNLSLPKSNFQF